MIINRNEFIDSIARNSPTLDLIFLNHSGAPEKLFTDISTIDVLVDKQSKADFIAYCRTHPLVNKITEYPKYQYSIFEIGFFDGSVIKFKVIRNMIRRFLICMRASYVRQRAHINEHGMLVSSNQDHYDYTILSYQFAGQEVPDRYKNYFSTLKPSVRAEVFKHMQSRYHLVFNTLEELFKPSAKKLLTIMVGLRGEKQNSLFRMFFRTVAIAFFHLLSPVTKRARHYIPLHDTAPPQSQSTEVSQKAIV